MNKPDVIFVKAGYTPVWIDSTGRKTAEYEVKEIKDEHSMTVSSAFLDIPYTLVVVPPSQAENG